MPKALVASRLARQGYGTIKMNINNLNTYQKPVISMADMCLARLEKVELIMDVTPRRKKIRSRDWVDMNGCELNDLEMMKTSGLTMVSLRHLWNKYKGDCRKILTCHGLGLKKRGGRTCTKYRDKDGNRVGQRPIMKEYGLSQKVIAEIFEGVEFDHVKAHEAIELHLINEGKS